MGKYVILKDMGSVKVLLNNGFSEILEFESSEEAERIAKIFEKNSEAKYKYIVKPKN